MEKRVEGNGMHRVVGIAKTVQEGGGGGSKLEFNCPLKDAMRTLVPLE